MTWGYKSKFDNIALKGSQTRITDKWPNFFHLLRFYISSFTNQKNVWKSNGHEKKNIKEKNFFFLFSYFLFRKHSDTLWKTRNYQIQNAWTLIKSLVEKIKILEKLYKPYAIRVFFFVFSVLFRVESSHKIKLKLYAADLRSCNFNIIEYILHMSKNVRL